MTDNEQINEINYDEERRQLYLQHSKANLPIYISEDSKKLLEEQILILHKQDNIPLHLLVIYEALSMLPLTNNNYNKYVLMLKDINDAKDNNVSVKGFIFEVKEAQKEIEKQKKKNKSKK